MVYMARLRMATLTGSILPLSTHDTEHGSIHVGLRWSSLISCHEEAIIHT
jgi:hypothetical protein